MLEELIVKVDTGDFPDQKLDLNQIPSIARILSKEFSEKSKITLVDVDFLIIDIPLDGLQMISSDLCC